MKLDQEDWFDIVLFTSNIFFQCLDASRTWICYWTLHALELLNVSVTDEIRTAVISFIDK